MDSREFKSHARNRTRVRGFAIRYASLRIIIDSVRVGLVRLRWVRIQPAQRLLGLKWVRVPIVAPVPPSPSQA